MAEKRDKLYIYVTWISKLIAGDSQCEWAAWYRAHFKTERSSSSGFSLVKWTINHNNLLHKRRDQLEQQGYTVTIEDQNSFKASVPGTDIVISGKVDVLALPGPVHSIQGRGIIDDCKTGWPKNSDLVQVMLYMMCLPLAIEKYRDIIFDGQVIYKDSTVPVYWTDVDDDLKEVVWDLVKRVGGDEPCRKVPSYNECKWCDISKEDCPQKMED